MTNEPIAKKIKIDPEEQKTYLIAVDYEDMAACPVKILMHGVAPEDRTLIEYMETHQEASTDEWADDMLLAIEHRVDDRRWRPGKELEQCRFSEEWDKHIQYHDGNFLPAYFGRIDRCLHVEIPDWASSSEGSSSSDE